MRPRATLRRVRWSLAVVLVLLIVAPAARAEVPGDTRATAIPLTLGVPATADTREAHREEGDPDGGHSVWFRYDPPAEGTVAIDFGGTDFDVVSAWAGTNALGAFLNEGEDEPHPSVQRGVVYYQYGTVFYRLDGATPQDVGTARVTARLGPAPEDRWANPVPLDLGGTAVASASGIYAAQALEPGEPGGAEDHESVWFAFVAPATGSVALDACLGGRTSQGTRRAYLRVLDDRPLGEAAVVAEGLSARDPGRCVPVVVPVEAGKRYRVQATPRPDAYGIGGSGDTRVLRVLSAVTPPAVDAAEARRGGDGFFPSAEIRPAPGAALVSVACTVNGTTAPCVQQADGTWAGAVFVEPQSRLRNTFVVRATDTSGRVGVVKEDYRFATPTGGAVAPPQAPAPQVPRPAAPLRALKLPRARFTVTARGARVRSLLAPGLPKGATVALRCSGTGCPLRSRRLVASKAGTLALTGLLRKGGLRRGVRLTVTVAAAGRRGRSVTWTVRARRAPLRKIAA